MTISGSGMTGDAQPENSAPRRKIFTIRFALGVLLFIVALPYIILWLIVHAICAVLIHLVVWVFRSPYVLFIYSDSPLWQSYIEQHIIPKLPPRSVVLNWSERRNWKWWWLSSLCFSFFAGRRAFNPLAIVIYPFQRARTFRFFQAFRDFKQGNRARLIQVETEFFDYLIAAATGSTLERS
jgi:hypothetical protein